MSRRHFLEPLLAGDEAAAPTLSVARLGAPLATALETAFDSATRKKGLLGRREFAEGAAIIIAPCNAVHTWFMRFPIDIVFASRDGHVVKVLSAVRPWRIALAWRAFATIELPAGTAKRCGLQLGDQLAIGATPAS